MEGYSKSYALCTLSNGATSLVTLKIQVVRTLTDP